MSIWSIERPHHAGSIEPNALGRLETCGAFETETRDLSFCEGTASYSHRVRRSLQERQVGRASSHLTLRSLQLVQPRRDFLCGRLGMIAATGSAASEVGAPSAIVRVQCMMRKRGLRIMTTMTVSMAVRGDKIRRPTDSGLRSGESKVPSLALGFTPATPFRNPTSGDL